MLLYKISLVLAEGAIFSLVALGIYVAFRWVRFPDLTPDGSFALGAVACVLTTEITNNFALGLFAGLASGSISGFTTATLYRFVGIPSVVAGLLTASALYSVNWLLLDGPNFPLTVNLIPFADAIPTNRALFHALLVVSVLVAIIIGLVWFSKTLLGLGIRAIGENPLLAQSINFSENLTTFAGLGIANGLVGLAGALFVIRLYSADINMGLGITITGLAGMVLGMILIQSLKIWKLIFAIAIGAILYKLLLFIALELGFPAQSFRIVSAIILALAFLSVQSTSRNLLGGLKWT